MTKEYVDVVLVIPLPEEHDQIIEIFGQEKDLSDDKHVISLLKLQNSKLQVISILQNEMGKAACNAAVSKILERYDAGMFIVVGIAGNLSNDNQIGDVCYSNEVIDIYNNTAFTFSKKPAESLKVAFAPDCYKPDEILVSAIFSFRNNPRSRANYQNWISACAQYRERLISEEALNNIVQDQLPKEICARAGPIVCGSVVKSNDFKDLIKSINRQVVAIETESGGAYEATKSTKQATAIIAIRGISDNADDEKEKLEKTTGGVTRKIAAHNAVLFVYYLLQTQAFINAVLALKSAPDPQRDKSQVHDQLDPLQKQIQKIQSEIDTRLRELSPEYRSKPSGYMLPAPRFVRDKEYNLDLDGEGSSLIDVFELITYAQVPWIVLERNYPDESLPWVIAHHILAKEIDSVIYLPIVIDGEAFSSPQKTISNILKPYCFEEGYNFSFKPFIILNNPNITTKNRRNFLRGQLEEYGNENIILISRDNNVLRGEEDIVASVNAQMFSVDRVSFQDLATFLIKSFQMDTQKAEVIAKRLDATFERFNLLAHPSYFAGIPEQILLALLRANRRSELIQLAVDGFLTFVVAEDEAEVTLSRTTRQRFLQKLVYQMKVERIPFSKVEVIQRASEYSHLMDYGIDSVSFIQGFFKAGILREIGGRIEFALPYFEHYLLALEISENPGSELKYFDFEPDNFDFATFDLYCEICDSAELIQAILQRLEQSIKDLTEIYPGKHILSTINSLHFNAKNWDEQVKRVQKHLAKAMKDIDEDADNKAQKQAEIDLLREVRRVVAQQRSQQVLQKGADTTDDEQADAEQVSENGAQEKTHQIKRDATFNFRVSCVALGAGAERLNAKIKKPMIDKTLALASNITNGWLTDHSNLSAASIASDIRQSVAYRDFIKSLDTEQDLSQINAFVDQISRILPMFILRRPITFVFHDLTEYARHKVLGKTISTCNKSDHISEIFRGVWLTEVLTDNGMNTLNNAFKGTKISHFLRFCVAQHLITRVRWDHYKKNERKAMLKLANRIIKPLEISYDMRKIEQNNKLR